MEGGRGAGGQGTGGQGGRGTGDRGRETGRKGGGKQDSQSEKCKEAEVNKLTNTGREPGLKGTMGTGSGRFKPPPPPPSM